MFTEGGTLASPTPLNQVVFLPPALELVARAVPRDVLPVVTDPTQITGCIMSSLLATRYPDLPPTIGTVAAEEAVAHYERLTSLGFKAAPLHCESVMLDPALVTAFRERFGTSPGQPAHSNSRIYLNGHGTSGRPHVQGTK
jgi:hypothetical protein